MTVQLRSSAVATNVSGTSASSVTVTKPSQTADGDLMLFVTNAPAGTVTPPAGLVLLGSVNDAGATQSNLYKKIASSEGASYAFTFSVSSACAVGAFSFMGANDVHLWSGRGEGTDATPECSLTDAARDSVGLMVSAWSDTVTNTVTSNQGVEQFDTAAANTGSTLFRGMASYYFGPPSTSDIVNIGDSLPGTVFTITSAPTGSVAWQLLVDDKAPDTENWSSTNGDFGVDLLLDTIATDQEGSITTRLTGDVTGLVSAVTSSGEAGGSDENLKDGLASSKWQDNAATAWAQYDFGASVTKAAKRYRLTSASSLPEQDPMNWTLQGSQNGTDFTVLDTRTNESFASRGEVREFATSNTTAYRYYRLDVTANKSSGATAAVSLAEFRLSTHSVWEDVTTYVNEESKIRITRGLQGASGRSDFSRAYYELNNTDGRFSTKNSGGAYYGALQRNTQTRIYKAYGTKSLQLQGAVRIEGTDMCGDGIRCPLTSALQIAGDMDVRLDLEPESWRDEQMLCGVSTPETDTQPWWFMLMSDGRLQLGRYDGTDTRVYTSTLAVPQTTARRSLRATLDADNGASGSTVTFYTADTFNVSWVQLGDPVIVATTASTVYGGGAFCVGHVGGESERGIHGLVYNFELYTGIAGSTVSDIDFTSLTNGAHSFTENSNRWVTINTAVVSNRRYRFHGEVAEWPVAWDPTGTWITASATGAGVQRRLERGNSALSAMRRYNTKAVIDNPGAFERFASPANYWPMEDKKNSFQLASGLPSKPNMTIYGSPAFEETDGQVFNESDELIKLNLAKFGGRVTGAESGYADIRWLHYSPTDMAAGSVVMEVFGTGSVRRWTVTYEASDTWRVRGFDETDTGTASHDTGNQTITTNGEAMHVQLLFDNLGADVAVTMQAYDVYGTSLGSWLNVVASATVGKVTRVNINPFNDIGNTYVGHVSVYGVDSPPFDPPNSTVFRAHHYEPAGTRIARITKEEQIEFRHAGGLADSGFMGYQGIDTPFSIMSSAAVTDDGYLVDPLDAFGIEYRTGRSVYNQPPTLTVSYSSGDLTNELRPTQDDSHILNDFTASRGGAGSARFQRTDGALSVQQPTEGGVGPYEDAQSYSLAHEGQCVDIASWQVHKGTLDEERYPRIELALENLRIAADTTKTENLLKLDVGKRVDITDPPDFLVQDDIRQIVIGYEEWFDNFQHNFKLNTIPERIFEVAGYDTSAHRFDHDEATLYQDIDATKSTNVFVVTDTGPKWSTTADDFDVVIDGERMTVTAVAVPPANFSTDTFNRADSTTNLGSTDGGVVNAWVQNSGTWGINSNQAYISAAAASIATIPGSDDLELLQVDVNVWASGTAHLVFRFTDTSNYIRWGGTVGSPAALEVVSAGVVTLTATAEDNQGLFTLAAGDTLAVACDESVIECFVNGRLALCVSDTTHQSASRVGMRLTTTAPRLDNFSMKMLTPIQGFAVTRSVNGVSATHKAGAAVKLYQTPYRGL